MTVDGFGYLVAVLKELPLIRQRGECCELPKIDVAWAEATSNLLKALADPTRLKMLVALWEAEDPICICDFTATFALSQPTISHHMSKLRDLGLVEADKQGIWIYYRLSAALPASTREVLSSIGQSQRPKPVS